jgi:hypothetical protein
MAISPINVPYTGSPDVTSGDVHGPREIPTPSVSVGGADRNPDAFGVNVAEAWGHLGEISAGAGKELFDRAYALQELQAHANVSAKVSDVQNQQYDTLAQFQQTEGKNAVDGYGDFQSKIGDLRTQGAKGLSPYETQLYDDQTRQSTSRMNFQGADHAAQQGKDYTISAAGAVVQSEVRGMSLDPTNQAANDASIAKITNEVNHQADVLGLSPEARKLKVDTTIDSAVQQQVSALARTNATAARALYDQSVKSGRLFTNDALKLDEQLKALQADQEGHNIARDVTGGAPPPKAIASDAPATGTGTGRVTQGDGQAHDSKGNVVQTDADGNAIGSGPKAAPAGAPASTPSRPTGASADRVASGGVLGTLINAESGGHNIVSGTDGDSRGLKASQGGNANEISQGYFQIQNHPGGTWDTFARKAGVDLTKYPTPRSAPYDVQWQVAQTIPVDQWGGRTKNILRAQGYNFSPGETLGQLVARYGGGNVTITAGGGGSVGPADRTLGIPTQSNVPSSGLTPDDARDRSLEDKIADAQARAQAIAPDNPRVMEQAVAQVEAQDSKMKRAQEDTYKRDDQTISGAIFAPPAQGQQTPSTLGDLRASPDPKVREAVERMIKDRPSEIPKFVDAMNKAAKGDVPETEARLRTYAQLKGQSITDPEGFAKVDVLSADLPLALKKELLDAQIKGGGKAAPDENIASTFRIPGVANQLQTLGITPKTEDYNLLAAEVGDEIKQFVTDNGRSPNSAEKEEIVTRLLQDKAVAGTGFFGSLFGGGTEKAYKIGAPETWRASMRQQVQSQRGYIPTDMELDRAWNQAEYQKEYGGGGKAKPAQQNSRTSVPAKAGAPMELPGATPPSPAGTVDNRDRSGALHNGN